MMTYRPRIIIAGEMAGAWGEFGGFGGQVCLRLRHVEESAGNNAEAMARLSDGGEPLPHMARSRMDPSEVSSVIFEPDRGRRLRVIDERRRAYRPRAAQAGAPEKNRGYSAPKIQGSPRGGPREPASKSARKKRPRRKRDSESREASPNSPSSK